MLKLASADGHARRLLTDMDLWTASNPISYTPELSADRMSCLVRANVLLPPPTEQWSLIVGDFVHNIRGALDAMVWSFATADGRKPSKPRRVYFPIVTEAAGWDTARIDMLQTVPDEVAERIASVQPFTFTDPNQHMAVVLRDMSNTDKHQSSIHVRMKAQSIGESGGLEFFHHQSQARARQPQVRVLDENLGDSAVLLELKSDTPFTAVPDVGYQIATVPSVETTIGVKPVMSLLSNLSRYAREALTIVWRGELPDGFGAADEG